MDGTNKKANKSSESKEQKVLGEKKKQERKGLNIEGYQIEGISIAGHETCVIIPSLNLAFDIGKCPQRAISQQFLFISHGHMDHIVCKNFSSIRAEESLFNMLLFGAYSRSSLQILSILTWEYVGFDFCT